MKYPFKPVDLTKLEPAALVWLYKETQRIKFVQPMGLFADYRRNLESDRVKIRVLNDGRHTQLVRVGIPSRGLDASTRPTTGAAMENDIVAITLPQYRFTPFAEPCAIVKGFTKNPKTEAGKVGLQRLRSLRRKLKRAWTKNGAPDPRTATSLADGLDAALPGDAQKVLPFNVHTGRSTVNCDADQLSAKIHESCHFHD